MYNQKKLKQGIYKPVNKEKYIGKISNIIYRSGLEKKYFRYCDFNPNILEWSSEEVVVPYVSIDNKTHRYFLDLYIKVKTKTGEIKKFIIEIKPRSFTVPPKLPKKGGTSNKFYKESVKNFLVNKAKWEEASKFAKKNDMEFKVLTEFDI